MRNWLSRNLSTLFLAAVIALLSAAVYPIAQAAFTGDIAWQSTGKLLLSGTAPTVTSGFGNTPSIGTNNGAANFLVNVGTGGTAWSGIIGLPAATNRWSCTIVAPTPGQTTKQTGSGTTASGSTAITVWNYGTGLLTTAWNASDLLQVQCYAM